MKTGLTAPQNYFQAKVWTNQKESTEFISSESVPKTFRQKTERVEAAFYRFATKRDRRLKEIYLAKKLPKKRKKMKGGV